MATFKWADQYGKKGGAIFDEKSLRAITLIERKYGKVFREFFVEVGSQYRGLRRTPEQKYLDDTTEKLDNIRVTLQELMKVTVGSPVPRDKVDQLYSDMSDVDEAFRFFSNPDNISAPLQKRLQETEKKSGITVAEISKANQALKGRMSQLGRPSPGLGDRLAPLSPLTKPLGDLARGSAEAVLGPMYGIAKAAGQAVGGIGAGILRAQKAKRKRIADEAFINSTLLPGEQTPEGAYKAYKYMNTEGVGPFEERARNNPFGRGKESTQEYKAGAGAGLGAAPFFNEGMPGTKAGRGTSAKALQEGMLGGLQLFFGGVAYKTRWTKELLESVQGKGIGSSKPDIGKGANLEGIFGNLLGNLGKLAPLLKGLGAAAAVAGSAFAGWKLGEWLEKNNVLGVGKGGWVEKGMTGVMGIGNKITEYKNAETQKKSMSVRGITQEQIDAQKARGRANAEQSKTSLGEQAQPDKQSLELRGGGTPNSTTAVQPEKNGKTGAELGNTSKEGLPGVGTTSPASNMILPIEGIPAKSGAMVDTLGPLGEKLIGTMNGILGEFKKSGVQQLNKIDSGFDAYNIRNPLLASLNSGMVDIT